MDGQQIVDATPLMKQYHKIKAEYPDSLLLFQVGDFYELFYDDAKTASQFLAIALTKRGKNNGEPIPLCGVPMHAIDFYLTKLVRGGFKVAICDQLEEAQPGKVVNRGVTRVLTPGTLTDSRLLDEKSASYLFAFFPMENQWGLVFAELLTAQLYATMLPADSDKIIEAELSRFFPDEILVPSNKRGQEFQAKFRQLGYFTTFVDSKEQQELMMQQWMQQQFPSDLVTKINNNDALQLALSTFHAYLSKHQQQALSQFRSINFYKPEDFLMLDAATARNLELVKNNSDGGRKNTLYAVLDFAASAMGSRTLKKWILRPLINKDAIVQRQQAIGFLLSNITIMQQLQELIKEVGDIERTVGRIALGRALVADYLMLRNALELLPKIKILLNNKNVILLDLVDRLIDDFTTLHQLLDASLNDDSSKEWLIKSGFDQSFDAMRALVELANIKIIELEKREQEKTGISSLKIRYNQVHGYYIEITKANLDSVPDYYKRQQTLVGKERFMIPELHELQHEINSARNQIAQVEKEIFESIKKEVATYITPLRKMSYALAHLDALLGLSLVAYNNGYICPQLNENNVIYIEQGRHPVIEQTLKTCFIANDINLNEAESLLIITGPNMGGKSTYLRQVAIICLMAHIGSFVPAKSANIALLDRIFTRIGAGDNLAEGKSTFLVEMEETASICNYATKNSLVILDEVGRGTSTFDGLAIAQAVIEYIYYKVKARCLFATHYHELALLGNSKQGIASYYAASKKTANGILFLYTMVKGIADGSFGIEVAKLAHLPTAIIDRSQQILHEITAHQHQQSIVQIDVSEHVIKQHEQTEHLKKEVERLRKQLADKEQLLKMLSNIDYEMLSPKMAFDLLWKIKDNVGT